MHRKGKGKGAHIPCEADALLSYEGFGAVQASAEELLSKLTKAQLDSWTEQSPNFTTVLRSLGGPLQKVWQFLNRNAAVQTYARVSIPAEGLYFAGARRCQPHVCC